MRIIVDRHSAAMLARARVVVRDAALAEDVVQESLVKVWLAWSSFRGESSRRSWILRITHNTAVSTLRARRDCYVSPADLDDAAGAHDLLPEQVVIGRAMASSYGAALGRLDPHTRALVMQRAVHGASYLDIARAFDLPLPTVRTRLFRARRLLATYLAAWTDVTVDDVRIVR